uniref:Replication factor A protein 3 n=1 Tax=Picea sitchensis TaxID=3332 RepID=D5AA58_PICSI|nr:unknown [Picea sitchensis]
MDTSNPAVLVNGEVIRRYVGRRVRCVLKVIRGDGGILQGETSDGQQISVKQAPPAISLSQFVEVIGIAENDRTIRAEICTNFGDKFEMSSYNQLCQLANSEHQSLFI